MKERKVGEKFRLKVNGKQTTIKCVKDGNSCIDCIFSDKEKNCCYNPKMVCERSFRKDNTDVHFEEVKK